MRRYQRVHTVDNLLKTVSAKEPPMPSRKQLKCIVLEEEPPESRCVPLGSLEDGEFFIPMSQPTQLYRKANGNNGVSRQCGIVHVTQLSALGNVIDGWNLSTPVIRVEVTKIHYREAH